MNDDLESQLVERLRALGQQPVAPAVRSAHLLAMAQDDPAARRRHHRVKIVAIAVAAALLLSTGLAVAQVDTGPLKPVHEKIAGVLGADISDGKVTHGTARHYGGECLPIADGKGAANHGQYLKWVREHRPDQLEAAKASNCGKPLTAGQGDDEDADDDVEDQNERATTSTTSARAATATTSVPVTATTASVPDTTSTTSVPDTTSTTIRP
jgi:hypothetical protein